MKFLLVFCFITIISQVRTVYSQNAVNQEVINSMHSTFEMYRRLYDENVNFVFSPLSFRIIYSILYHTSKFNSEIELKRLLYNTTNLQNSDLIDAQSQNIAHVTKSPKIRLANKIYLADDVHLKPYFRSLVKRYSTSVQQVDFKHETSENITYHMNNWIEEQTNGLIKNLIEPSSISPDVQLFLINTIYFKADWLSPFTKHNVFTKPFTSIDGINNSINTICETDFYNVAFNDELNADVLELPYTHGSDFAFWIILPRPQITLAQLKDSLSVDFFNKIKISLSDENAEIQFPIFEIESSIDGRQITPSIFGREEFDIIEGNLLAVDEIKQKAKIIVNTKGTEAAASTYMKVIAGSMPQPRPEPKLFIADRPFIYALVSNNTKEPVFIGHYLRP